MQITTVGMPRFAASRMGQYRLALSPKLKSRRMLNFSKSALNFRFACVVSFNHLNGYFHLLWYVSDQGCYSNFNQHYHLKHNAIMTSLLFSGRRKLIVRSFGSSKNIQREKVGHIVQFRVMNLHQ